MNLSTLPIESASQLLSLFGSTNQKSALRLSTLGLPNNKTEQYRFFAIKPLLQKEYPLTHKEHHEIEEAEYIEIKNGVIFKAPKHVKIKYSKPEFYHEENFDALYHLSHVASAEIVHIEMATEYEKPLKIIHKFSAGMSIYRVVLSIKANIHAHIVEECELEESAFGVYGYDITIADDASLEFIRNQTLNAREQLIGSHDINIGKNASLNLKTYDFGTGTGLHLYSIELQEDASLKTAHLLDIRADSKQGNVLHVKHLGKSSKSSQEAKYILNDTATGIFDGRIVIAKTALHASARQNSKAMILSQQSGVKMIAKPQLEIYTDELEASHGSSTGQLDTAQLFYLRSRGISQSEAKKMLIFAFANELINKIENEATKEEIQEAFNKAHKG